MERVNELATIDVSLVVMKTSDSLYALDTASKIAVEIQTETKEPVKLVIKGRLKAQKGKSVTITGNKITLTDNVFSPEIVQILQGGVIEMGTGDKAGKIVKYTPPVAGSDEKGEVFDLDVYSAIYDSAALLVGYEKTSYPNCQGEPMVISSEDNVFRVSTYTINSAPKTGEAPYVIEYVDELPVVA